jgi:hypothetical protein
MARGALTCNGSAPALGAAGLRLFRGGSSRARNFSSVPPPRSQLDQCVWTKRGLKAARSFSPVA